MSTYGTPIFVKYLKLNPHVDRHVIECPFHIDVGTKSLSVDLTKALFYCFGGCDDPKGGSAIEFLVKWARVIDGQTITKDDARHQVNQFYREPETTPVEDASDDELELFTAYMPTVYATAARYWEGIVTKFAAKYRRALKAGEEWAWSGLDACQTLAHRYSDAFEICLPMLGPRFTANEIEALLRLFHDAKARGDWTLQRKAEAGRVVYAQERYAQQLAHVRHLTAHPASPSEAPCPEPPSILKISPTMSRKSPVTSTKSPVTIETLDAIAQSEKRPPMSSSEPC